MRLPAYWWLLAMTVLGQGGFFARRAILRLRRDAGGSPGRAETAVLAASCLAGLAYGAVQSDPVFVVGQACLMILYYRMRRENDDG
ncbi:lipid A biosynthesis domain-containing protein [Pseudodesulfovibrio sp.]|uniref:lipid A biosynthesis domain-containing protein n=1 Tax=Pseudodesulfovibrio sp. TaxID=2035812 RepID=UPI002602653B|nr:lipid A biosynthesis domain-containing protein [Pseudodesulfovibrio sp.]MDD3313626.1 lipid A biosynthesis domain-containing protein [Pseudodesulfovibrio sp.]